MNIKRRRPSLKLNKIESPSIKPKESVICKSFVTRFKHEQAWGQMPRIIDLYHIPNENMTSHRFRWQLMHMGAKAGLPDYLIVYLDGIAFIEFKRTAKGKLTCAQLKFFEIMEALGIKCLCTHDIDIAITFCKNL